ncbi:MAG TPA: ABC transporter permease [Rhodanobacteraceae bacterium]|nr:ABC transporter permease [Rhodanobacteraceae bacterium]
MNKIFAVVRREFVARVRTKAFVITTVLLPVLMVAFMLLPALMMSASDHTSRIAIVDASGTGLGQRLHDSLAKQKLDGGKDAPPRYEISVVAADGDAEAARDKLIPRVDASKKASDKKTLDGVLVLDHDVLSDGRITYYGRNVGSMESMAHLRSSLSQVLATARLGQSGVDPALVMRSMEPAHLKTSKVTDGKITGQSGAASFLIAYIMGFILYLAIIIYGQQTMTSVIEEKTSRIMEVLASSLTPFQMLLGKVLGVGSAGLAQMLIWGGSIFVLTSQREAIAKALGISAAAMQNLPIPTMSGGLLVVFLVYFALGFLLYGALYAAVGAICNTIQETQQYATFVTILIAVGFISVFSLIKDPSGSLGVTMSFIPFFSPFTMPVRWSLASVPTLQLAASLLLIVVALLACVWLAARIYRTGILMYGKKPSFGELWRWVRAG